MKNVFKYLVVLVVSTTFIGGVAGAASCTGTISVTGAGSTNQISCNEVNNIVVTCDNNIIVGTVNTQTGSSGNANSGNNTTSGTAASGSVVNENGQNITIGAGCDQTTLTSTPTTPGKGGGGGGGEGAVMPQVLPDTSTGQQILPLAIGGLILSGLALLAARFSQRLRSDLK